MPHRIENCDVIAETEKAILIKHEDFDEGQQWIPQSQIHADSEIWEDGQSGALVIKTWFAEKLGLI